MRDNMYKIGCATLYSTPLCLNHCPMGGCSNNFEVNFYSLIRENCSLGFHCEITFKWKPPNLTNKESILVQVMHCCHQVSSHYQSNVDPDLCHHTASLGHNELNTRLFQNLIEWDCHKSTVQCKTAVSPLLMQWRYCSLALNCWYCLQHFFVDQWPQFLTKQVYLWPTPQLTPESVSCKQINNHNTQHDKDKQNTTEICSEDWCRCFTWFMLTQWGWDKVAYI